MPVNPYENLTAVACLRTEAARKGRYGQFAGSADTSQAKCKRGPTTAFPSLYRIESTIAHAGPTSPPKYSSKTVSLLNSRGRSSCNRSV